MSAPRDAAETIAELMAAGMAHKGTTTIRIKSDGQGHATVSVDFDPPIANPLAKKKAARR